MTRELCTMPKIISKARQIWYGLSLQSKLTASALMISLVPFFILAASANIIGHRFAKDIVKERNQYLAEHIAAHVEELLAEKVSTLKLVAATPDILFMNRRRQETQLAAIVKLDPDLLIAATVDRSGRQIARSDRQPPDPTINYADRPYFASALSTKQTALSDTQASRTTGILSIAIAQPILDEHLEPQGLVIAAVDLQKLIDLIRQYPVGETGFSFLLNSKGDILYHPTRNIGENLTHLTPFKLLQNRDSGADQYELDGQNIVSGFAVIKPTGWFLVVRQPLNEAMADMLYIQKIIFFLFIFAIGLSIFIGSHIARTLSRPISDLTSMAESLAKGDLNASIWVQDTAELRTLAKSFNNMANQIQKREADLKEREQRYRSVVESLNIGVYRKVDQNGVVDYYANPALMKIFGCSSMNELFSADLFHFLMKQTGFRTYIDLMRKENHVKNLEFDIHRRDGAKIWCSCTASRYSPPGSHLTWIDATIEDITERKLARERLQQAHDSLELKVRERTQELEELNEKLRALSLMDGLTGIANRRYFDEFLDREWRRAKRERQPISMLLLDVDHFKLYNDTYGHIAGDDCLKQIATTLKGITKRATDLAARYGGEEFALILPNTPQEKAAMLASKLLDAIEALFIEHGTSPVSPHVTVSIGGATYIPDRDSSPEIILLAADQALYNAKQSGRNQVFSHPANEQPS